MGCSSSIPKVVETQPPTVPEIPVKVTVPTRCCTVVWRAVVDEILPAIGFCIKMSIGLALLPIALVIMPCIGRRGLIRHMGRT